MEEKFKFFWKSSLSQWKISPFTFDGITFNCCEQFMMFGKAVYFGDLETAELIMNCDDPQQQKKLGREVKNFSVESWAPIARDIVYVGNYCKYEQSAELKEVLLKTAGTTLVEASPYDQIWGIGLEAKDTRAQQRSTWQGKNWLGETITKVREDIISGHKNEQAFRLCSEIIKRYRKSE